jgi:hypothetical protein
VFSWNPTAATTIELNKTLLPVPIILMDATNIATMMKAAQILLNAIDKIQSFKVTRYKN